MRVIWVCFDLSNKTTASGYLWWFTSKRAAMARWQINRDNPDCAQLSKPVKLEVALGHRIPTNARLPCPKR